eukprot:PhM_4_TR5882/c0_g1_i1/m.15835
MYRHQHHNHAAAAAAGYAAPPPPPAPPAVPLTTMTTVTSLKIDPVRYKTKICRHFVESGACPFTARCVFAHGQDDMRSVEMNEAEGITTDAALRDYIIATAPPEELPTSALAPSTPTRP